ncbi:MAG: DUF4173 domain-containing protein [Acidimicrobiia bacterium]|nr:DUF4173 domain-containing protein [Acidimicrobiia bacterium]
MTTTTPPPLPVSTAPDRRSLLALVAGGVGIDVLGFHHPVGPGLAIGMLGIVGYLWWLGRSLRTFRWLVPAAMLLSVAVAWRASEVVVSVAILGFIAVVAIALRLLVADDLAAWTLTDYAVGALQGVGGSIAAGSSEVRETEGIVPRQAGLRRVLAGLALAIPVLVVFGALFASADAVFESRLATLFDWDVDFPRIVARVIVVGVLVVFGAGARRVWRAKTEPWIVPAAPWRVHPTQAATLLASVVGLFLTFVAVQLPYLFGGSDQIERSGVSVAEYARRGFFELVAVAALVVGLVLVIDWAVHRGGWSRSRLVDGLGMVLVGLTFVVLASAVQRMTAYTSLFGLTELRFYTSVFMVWVGIVLGLVVLAALRGHRDRLALGMFVSGLAILLALVTINPDGRIAQVNLARHIEDGTELDIEYVVWLGPDAVPVLISELDSVEDRCALVSELATFETDLARRLDRDDWRSTSISEYRASSRLDQTDLAGGCR